VRRLRDARDGAARRAELEIPPADGCILDRALRLVPDPGERRERGGEQGRCARLVQGVRRPSRHWLAAFARLCRADAKAFATLSDMRGYDEERGNHLAQALSRDQRRERAEHLIDTAASAEWAARALAMEALAMEMGRQAVEAAP
jgi:hypothetical protein